MTVTDSDHLVVISADSHAGGNVGDFRQYLPAKWHEEFDVWAATEAANRWNKVHDGREVNRNWDSDFRLAENEADGICAEVIFPNTVPPFYPGSALAATLPSTREEYERRFVGVQANNRWTVDFCAATPGRRRGVVQILLNDIDDALAEIRWGKEAGLAAILIPGVRPGHELDGLWSSRYDPIWALAEELEMPIDQHAGAGAPEVGPEQAAMAAMNFEVRFYAQRTMWHLVYGGVFERFPRSRFVLTELGLGWVGPTMSWLEKHFTRLADPRVIHHQLGGGALDGLSLRPSEYVRRNCFITWSGDSDREEIDGRHDLGVDHVMWGSDYPHDEGSHPYSREALRSLFSDVPVDECRRMLGLNAAALYGFDLDLLAPVAERVCPTVSEIQTPLERYPDGSTLELYLGKLPEPQLSGS